MQELVLELHTLSFGNLADEVLRVLRLDKGEYCLLHVDVLDCCFLSNLGLLKLLAKVSLDFHILSLVFLVHAKWTLYMSWLLAEGVRVQIRLGGQSCVLPLGYSVKLIALLLDQRPPGSDLLRRLVASRSGPHLALKSNSSVLAILSEYRSGGDRAIGPHRLAILIAWLLNDARVLQILIKKLTLRDTTIFPW